MSSAPLLWVDAAWLVLLVFGYIVVRRELAILEARTRLYGGSVPDGLDVGVAAPKIVGIADADVFVFLFGDCSSCHELVGNISKLEERTGLAIVVRDGSMPNAARSLERLLPADVVTHTGDMAERLVDSFKVHSGPLGIAVRSGVVVAKGYLRDTGDIQRLAAGSPRDTGARA